MVGYELLQRLYLLRASMGGFFGLDGLENREIKSHF
jgi:hypothetical protein